MGMLAYFFGNWATHRPLKASQKPKATSSTCSYNARKLLSAVIGSVPIQRTNAESDNNDLGLKKALEIYGSADFHDTHAGGGPSRRSPF